MCLGRRFFRRHLDAHGRWLHLRGVFDMDDVFRVDPLQGIELSALWHRNIPCG